jgi:hypothetical protein
MDATALMAGSSRMLDDEAQERRTTSDLMRKVESAAVRKLTKRYHVSRVVRNRLRPARDVVAA